LNSVANDGEEYKSAAILELLLGKIDDESTTNSSGQKQLLETLVGLKASFESEEKSAQVNSFNSQIG